jgi:hypothetical protein
LQGTADIILGPAWFAKDQGSILHGILGLLDPFDFWMIGIHLVGLGVVGTLTPGKHRATVLVGWILFWSVRLAIILAGSRFQAGV